MVQPLRPQQSGEASCWWVEDEDADVLQLESTSLQILPTFAGVEETEGERMWRVVPQQ